mgnify:CR=1 FL=1
MLIITLYVHRIELHVLYENINLMECQLFSSLVAFSCNVLLLDAVMPVSTGVVVACVLVDILCVTVLWSQVLMMTIWSARE